MAFGHLAGKVTRDHAFLPSLFPQSNQISKEGSRLTRVRVFLTLVSYGTISKIMLKDVKLVGGLEHFFGFPCIGNVIIPIDFHIFQRGRYTTNQSDL